MLTAAWARAYADAVRSLRWRRPTRESAVDPLQLARRRERSSRSSRRQAYPDDMGLRRSQSIRGASGGFIGQIDFLAKSIAAHSGEGTGCRQAGSSTGDVGVHGICHEYRSSVLRQRRATRIYLTSSTSGFADRSGHILRSSRRCLSPKAEELVANHVPARRKEPTQRSSSRTASESLRSRSRRRDPSDSRSRSTTRSSSRIPTKRRRVDRLGNPARGHDPLGLDDHGDVADAERAGRMASRAGSQRARLVDRACRCGRRPEMLGTTDRRGFIAPSSPNCPTRSASSSRGRSRQSTCRRPRSVQAWRYSAGTRRSSSRTARQMTVRSALARINEILDQVLNEQEGDFDSTYPFRDRLVPAARLQRREVRRRGQPGARAQHQR